MKSLLNTDFVKNKERLQGLGCKPAKKVKKKGYWYGVIIAEKAKKRFN
jgi:hypothetical protein